MIIATQQLEALGAPHKEAFIVKTLVFLRKECGLWAELKTEEEIIGHIVEMIKVGDEFDIRKEINIQKVIYYQIKCDLSLPFTSRLQSILAPEGLNEDTRVLNMIKYLNK